ncbi:hypothetical protein LS684_19365 [Cytobacillus spongiae]|uniref:hypothetical protein n=1 Tax=Cytobacillus spongiae TaxID=2901381 RepID=UPI001F2EBDC1|nr:hypothetical protein [Cytobacillus spongiae]UII55757.1 hypothetical protein LS684_19365 [Cytobacillus spongiae]
MEVIIRCGKVEDLSRLVAFLEKAGLGTDGVKDVIDYFLLMEDDHGELKATVGIEPLGSCGLLRSLVMTPKASESDLLILLEQMLLLARDKSLQSVYLATNKQASLHFFETMGFVEEEKSGLPTELQESEHVRHILSVDNSLFMKLSL